MDMTPAVGEKAHDFELPDSKGERQSLSDLLNKGNLMLVFFRGMW